jgi:DNA-binding MarR family transcriptional regulator
MEARAISESRTGPAKRASGTAVPTSNDQMLDVLGQFRIVLRAIKQHYLHVEKSCGVSGAQLWCMERIAATRGLAPGDLARELSIHPSTASNLLARLEELKLVQRRRAEIDHRRVHLYLTAKGQAVLSKAPRPLKGVLQQALQDLPPASLAGLRKRLAELVDMLQVRDTDAQSRPLSDL